MTARGVGWAAMATLTALVLAVAGPRLVDLAFAVEAEPTDLFFSPVSESFVFREHRGGHDFVYGDSTGATFDRRTFETRIPFIYYRNMELWGLLPLELQGERFDAAAIRAGRQVFELAPRELADRRPSIAVHPLLETNPGRARLRFPEDVFRFTADAMEFVNVDTNRVDPVLTERFTTALDDVGFAFPARGVFGRPTILKPFDDGWFVVDGTGAVFHLRRVDGAPDIRRTPIPPNLGIRHIEVVENERREIRALLLTEDGRLFAVAYDDYGLIPLPSDGYAPDRMAYKLLVNPLYATAVYADAHATTAVAMTRDFEPIAAYSRPAPVPATATAGGAAATLAAVAFPWTLTLDAANGPYLAWRVQWSGPLGALGLALALAATLTLARLGRATRATTLPRLALVALVGPPGLAAVVATPWPRGP